MNDVVSVEVEGLDELAETFENIVRKYPDRAADLLVKQAKALRKDVVKQVKNDTDTDGTSRKSLAKVGSYGISKVQGFGEGQFIEISAKSPHFHLLENGHQMVLPKTRTVTRDGAKVKINLARGGETVGFVLGYHFMDTASRKRQIAIPSELASEVNRILQEEGLI